MRIAVILILSLATATAAACAPVTGERAAQIRAALDESSLSLEAAVALAQEETGSASEPGIGVIALFADRGLEETDGLPAFSVSALAPSEEGAPASAGADVRIDAASGDVVALREVPGLTPPCPDELPLREAIGIAEDAVGGEAITIAPDDDGQCNRQLQVLRPDALWSVKMDQAGVVLEEEEDDDAE